MSSTECPIGYQEISGGFCFAKGTEEKTFVEATKACRQLGGFLAEPRSEEISDAISLFNFQRKPFFIGLHAANNGTFYWLIDQGPLSYEDWEGPTPSFVLEPDTGRCVQITTNDRWDDCRCTDKLHYLCQANKGKFYPLVSSSSGIQTDTYSNNSI